MMFLFMLGFLSSAAAAESPPPVYQNPHAPVEARIDDLLPRLTVDEKVDLVSGNGVETHSVPRLGVPALKMTDGPLGVRWEPATAFASGMAMGASFDPEMVRRIAYAIGIETKAIGRDMLLGPNINMSRVSLSGRAFESFGEDPFLTSSFATTYIDGLQSAKVVATPKHFALNDEEIHRKKTNVIADDRTMNEIYFPPFLAAVKAGAWSVMAAYNRANGFYCTENATLLHHWLEDTWGFQGFVVSDWVATHDTVNTANAGLDVEMPFPGYYGDQLRAALKSGAVSEAVLDDKVRRLMRAMFTLGIFDEKDSDRPPLSEVNSPEHQKLALESARKGIVLLKNESAVLPGGAAARVLPIGAAARRIAVIGPNAAFARTSGAGSAEVVPFYSVSPLEGLKNRVGDSVQLVYAPGFLEFDDYPAIEESAYIDLKADYFANTDLSGPPVLSQHTPKIDYFWQDGTTPDPKLTSGQYSIRWTGKILPPVTGIYPVTINSEDGFRLFIDGKKVAEDWEPRDPRAVVVQVPLTAGHPVDLKLEYYHADDNGTIKLGWMPPQKQTLLEQASAAAKDADLALVFVGLSDRYETEGDDRETMDLPDHHAELIEAIAAANSNTVVVVTSGTPVTMLPWIDHVKGVIESWYLGQEEGNALADVLLGLFNPSGKLPVTFPKRWEDSSAYGHYPTDAQYNLPYGEGIFMGYRHFDSDGVEPLYPFGFGLSYTSFAYSDLKVEAKDTSIEHPVVRVSFTLRNAGDRAGAEVAQLYLRAKTEGIARPFQELKAFSRNEIAAGESTRIELTLDAESFQVYDSSSSAWKVLPGPYEVRIGTSSRDIRLSQEVLLK